MGMKSNHSPIRRSKSFDDLKIGADFRQSDSKQAKPSYKIYRVTVKWTDFGVILEKVARRLFLSRF